MIRSSDQLVPMTALVSIMIFMVTILTGCSVNPTYTVRVINDSRTALNARIEHRPKFAEPITLESITVKAGQERILGPVESPPMERVVLIVGRVNEMNLSPEHHILRRGSYVARISKGSSTGWSPYEVDLSKD